MAQKKISPVHQAIISNIPKLLKNYRKKAGLDLEEVKVVPKARLKDLELGWIIPDLVELFTLADAYGIVATKLLIPNYQALSPPTDDDLDDEDLED